jgi:hypothetical protein
VVVGPDASELEEDENEEDDDDDEEDEVARAVVGGEVGDEETKDERDFEVKSEDGVEEEAERGSNVEVP